MNIALVEKNLILCLCLLTGGCVTQQTASSSGGGSPSSSPPSSGSPSTGSPSTGSLPGGMPSGSPSTESLPGGMPSGSPSTGSLPGTPSGSAGTSAQPGGDMGVPSGDERILSEAIEVFNRAEGQGDMIPSGADAGIPGVTAGAGTGAPGSEAPLPGAETNPYGGGTPGMGAPYGDPYGDPYATGGGHGGTDAGAVPTAGNAGGDLESNPYGDGPGTGGAMTDGAMTDGERAGAMEAELNEQLAVFDGMILGEQQAIREGRNAQAGGYSGGGQSGYGSSGAGGGQGDGGSAPLLTGRARGTMGNMPDMPGDNRRGDFDGEQGSNQNIPDDIPDGSDDDVVARQLREAAMKEEDPELRERLWDEYRKYKGIAKR